MSHNHGKYADMVDQISLPGLLPINTDEYLVDVLQRRLVSAPEERLHKIFGFYKCKYKVWKSSELLIIGAGTYSFLSHSDKMFTRYRNPFPALIGVINDIPTHLRLEDSEAILNSSTFRGGNLAVVLCGMSSLVVNRCRLEGVGGFDYRIELVLCLSGRNQEVFKQSKKVDVLLAKVFAQGGF